MHSWERRVGWSCLLWHVSALIINSLPLFCLLLSSCLSVVLSPPNVCAVLFPNYTFPLLHHLISKKTRAQYMSWPGFSVFTVQYSSLELFLHSLALGKISKYGRVQTVSNVLEKQLHLYWMSLETPQTHLSSSCLLFVSLRSTISDQWAASWEDRAEEHNAGVEGALLPQQQPHWIWGQILWEGNYCCFCCHHLSNFSGLF